MSAISVDLAADESVVWTGRGDKLPWFAPADACIVPFTFLRAGGAGLAAVSAASKHQRSCLSPFFSWSSASTSASAGSSCAAGTGDSPDTPSPATGYS